MTIEERLEKLTERHEALAQSLELIAGMQKSNERRFEETDRRLGQVLEAITQLANIAESHGHRLDRQEGQ